MSKLSSCSACQGFLPPAAARCPHCDATVPRTRPFARLLAAASAGAVSITLMACYGMAPQRAEVPVQPACENGVQPDPDGNCPTAAPDDDGTTDDTTDDGTDPAPDPEVRAAPEGDGDDATAPQ